MYEIKKYPYILFLFSGNFWNANCMQKVVKILGVPNFMELAGNFIFISIFNGTLIEGHNSSCLIVAH